MTTPNTIIADLSAEVESLKKQRNDLLAAIENVEKVKGRYNTEIAWKRLAEKAKEISSAKGCS